MDKRKRIRRTITKKIKSCEFNMDTGCVELRFADGRMISIDCTAVENEVADNRFQRSELDYLIYNDPLAYTPKQNNLAERSADCKGFFSWIHYLASNASVYTLTQMLVRENPETPDGFCKTGCAPAELFLRYSSFSSHGKTA